MAGAVRGHWGVKSMNWPLDVEFNDDLSRYRTAHGAKNMASARHFALCLVRANRRKGSVRLGPQVPVPARNPPAQIDVNLDSLPCQGGALAWEKLVGELARPISPGVLGRPTGSPQV